MCFHNSGDGSHQHTSFSGQVAVNFLFKSGFKQIARSDTYAQRDHPVPGFSGSILKNGIAGVQPLAFEEQPPQRGSRSLGCHQDHIHIFGRDDARLIAVSDPETVRKVKRFARGQMFFNGGPYGDLSGIRKQILDDGPFFAGIFYFKQVHAFFPSVLKGLVPRR